LELKTEILFPHWLQNSALVKGRGGGITSTSTSSVTAYIVLILHALPTGGVLNIKPRVT
jgi:hypothetical protein